jgi:hypothetical protein
MNKSSCIAPALGVKVKIDISMMLITLLCAT